MHHPLCVKWREEGKLVISMIMDYIVQHHGNLEVFWDWSNW